MKTTIVLVSIVGYVALFAGFGSATTGVGACVLGTGFDFNYQSGDLGPAPDVGVYKGVNVGQNSQTGVFDSPSDFETQCCAESGNAPDCFAPVGSSQPYSLSLLA